MVSAEQQNISSENRRKVLIDDHPLVREGLADLISKEKDIVVCGWTKDIPQTIKAIENLKPDAITVDISLENASGLDLMKDIKVFP